MCIRSFFSISLSALALICLLPESIRAAAVVRSVGGDATVASITSARDQFRLDLGGGTSDAGAGSFGGVRREINWDAVPAAFSAPNNLPANFFNVNSPRGAIFSTPGSGFQVSGATTDAGAGQPAAPDFGNINANYTAIFQPFSAQRLFTALGSNITDVTFFVPGTSVPASVTGFGSVFTDIDRFGSTTLQFFDPANNSLGTFQVPAGTVPNESLSFLGVFFNGGELISKVRITSGDAALGAAVNDAPGNALDLVVMDDFLYSQPTGVPDTGSTAAFLGMALASMGALRRKFATT